MLTIQRLQTIRAVGASGSFTAAARELHCTQSAVSQQIATFEDELGLPLVVRQPRGVALTSAGRLLFEHAGEILGAVEGAERELRCLAGLDAARLRVATFQTVGATVLPEAIAEMRARHPGVEIEIVDLEPVDSLPALVRGEVDLAIVFDYAHAALEPEGAYRVEAVLEEPLYIGLPRDHPRAARRRLRFKQLAGERWIGGNAYLCRALMERLSTDAGFVPDVVAESEDYGTVQGMIAAGIGVSLLPALATFYLHPHVVAVSLEGNVGTRRVHVAVPAGDYELSASRAFREVLNEVAPRALANFDCAKAVRAG